ncbi:MAG: CorA family divalent cation transporter [Actinomycetota bacterium]
MSLHAVAELLAKQKLVESVCSREERRHDLVETVVHNQHLAELRAVLDRLPPAEIGRVMETLPIDDARRVWQLIDAERQDDVLWEIPPDLGMAVAGAREPRFRRAQVNAYELVDGRMRIVDVGCRKDMTALKPVWVDLLGTSDSERGWIARHFGLELPDPDEVTDLETSARFYEEENDEIHLHSNFLLDREGDSRSVPVASIVHRGILFTVRNEELPVFRLQRLRMRNQRGEIGDCMDVLLALYAADVEYSADALEDTYATLRRVGQHVLSENVSDQDAAAILGDIAEEEDLNGRIRGNMLDTQRAVAFLMRGKFLSAVQVEDAREIVRDIESLNTHTAFLFEKINFLMDATVGFININQNKRVSQLTVAGVVFMPLNVIAGIGGMSEFSMMTHDIPWPIAYGTFTVAMVLVGWATFKLVKLYDRRKRVAAGARQRS